MDDIIVVKVNDPMFDVVFCNWYENILIEMSKASPIRNITDRVDFYFGRLTRTGKVNSIYSDIRSNKKRALKSGIYTAICCYDTTEFSMGDLWFISRQIMSKNRRNDFILDVNSAINLTGYLDTDLLLQPIPDFNLLLINFTY